MNAKTKAKMDKELAKLPTKEQWVKHGEDPEKYDAFMEASKKEIVAKYDEGGDEGEDEADVGALQTENAQLKAEIAKYQKMFPRLKPAAPPNQAEIWRVEEDGKFIHGGGFADMKRGMEINTHHHPAGTIEKMQKSGVQLKKVREIPVEELVGDLGLESEEAAEA